MVAIPVVSAIIERERGGKIQILIQTRWKPDRDPVYSGTFEIPTGWIGEREHIYDALKREVYDETGLEVIDILPGKTTKAHSPRNDEAFAFQPFCCNQQIKGGKSWIGFVFRCRVKNTEPVADPTECKDIQWMDVDELKQLYVSAPEKIFTFQLPVFDYYFNHGNKEE